MTRADHIANLRRIALVGAILGFAGLAFLMGTLVAHFAFGVPIRDRATNRPITDVELFWIILIMAGGFGLFATAGLLILRWIKASGWIKSQYSSN